MRSLTRSALAAAVALAGCGNYSTEDLRFLAALPQREDLRVEVPSEGTAGALGVCLSGTADVWLWAKPTSDGLNAAVGFLVSLVDAVRRIPPTWRTEDARGWGPFDDENHPGNELRIVIVRRYPPASGGEPVHDYVFQARPKGTLPFTSILGGTFQGGSASRGSGGLVLDFEALWALGMNEADTPHGSMQVLYDRASDPVTIALQIAQGGFGVVPFAYGFAGYAGGGGAFGYAFRDVPGNRYEVTAGYDVAGAGRAQVSFTGAMGGSGGFRQCWDAGACLLFVDDPNGYSCGGVPCSFGTVADCPAVPAPPF